MKTDQPAHARLGLPQERSLTSTVPSEGATMDLGGSGDDIMQQYGRRVMPTTIQRALNDEKKPSSRTFQMGARDMKCRGTRRGIELMILPIWTEHGISF